MERSSRGPKIVRIWCICGFVLTGLAGGATAGDKESATVRTYAGWTVHVSPKLLAEQPKETARALELMRGQLEEIKRVVPQAAVLELQKVPIWFSPEYPGVPPHGEYHSSVWWLWKHSRNLAMVKSVEFTNVRIFEPECRRMPMMVLHELAHAYHDRVLGNDEPRIRKAYEKAKAGGKYDRVERRDAEGRTSMDRAYALTNPQEFFAEMTEAYFGTNDFYPYTRADLEKHDPELIPLLRTLWHPPPKKPSSPIKP
jgi:hypothetical protein